MRKPLHSTPTLLRQPYPSADIASVLRSGRDGTKSTTLAASNTSHVDTFESGDRRRATETA